MGLMDALNIFKKKDEDMSFLDNNPSPMGTPPLPSSQDQLGLPDPHMSKTPPGFSQQNQAQFSAPQMPGGQQDLFNSPPVQGPQNDHRMTMPLGDSLRRQQISAMDEPRQPVQQPQQMSVQKELEIISSKLDYLKASLETVNQRLNNLDHIVRQDMERRRW